MGKLTINAFNSEAIVLDNKNNTNEFSSIELFFLNPLIKVLNLYFENVAYIEILSGLRHRINYHNHPRNINDRNSIIDDLLEPPLLPSIHSHNYDQKIKD